jgi:hypothetical protein
MSICLVVAVMFLFNVNYIFGYIHFNFSISTASMHMNAIAFHRG